MVIHHRGLFSAVLSTLLAAMICGSFPSARTSAMIATSSRTFPETGKTVQERFLEYWDEHGGLPQQGYPISDELQEKSDTDGKTYTVQYFERALFELHPENEPPNDVLLALLGNFLYNRKYPSGAPVQTPNNEPGSQAFSQTNKRLGGVFLQYWQEHGGLAQQGYPISDEFVEASDLDGKPYTVQYFERAVFEKHPENTGTPYEVLLSQLGTFRYRDNYTTPSPTPTPASQATQPVPAGTIPSARAGHDLVYDDALKMVLLVNGEDAAGEPDGTPSKIWGWDGYQWKIVSADGPPVRSLGGVAYDPDRNMLVLYGGSTKTTSYDETWEWDGSTWRKNDTEGIGFWHHGSMAYDSALHQIVLYGGNLQATASTQSNISFPAETWSWDGAAWQQSSAPGLGARYHYAMTYDSIRDNVLLFGGSSHSRDFNDLWAWDGSTWTKYSPGGPAPSSRVAARMAFDERSGKAVLFGGLTPAYTDLDDTWTWDGTRWTLVDFPGPKPPARSHHAMAYDKQRGRIVLFGGVTGEMQAIQLQDTWEWDGATWAKVSGP